MDLDTLRQKPAKRVLELSYRRYALDLFNQMCLRPTDKSQVII